MTFEEFKTLAKGMKSAYTTPNFLPDEFSVKVWFRFLEDIPYDTATASIKRYITSNKYPPTIADIREISADIMTGVKMDWSESWAMVCRCISLYGIPNESKAYEDMDEATKEAVKRMGWQSLCMSQNQAVDRANYRMIYESIIAQKKQPYLIGNKPTLIGEPNEHETQRTL